MDNNSFQSGLLQPDMRMQMLKQVLVNNNFGREDISIEEALNDKIKLEVEKYSKLSYLGIK